jgi:hypothetical protein
MLGTEITHTVKIEFSDRLLGAIERILAIAILLLGYGLLIPLLFIPRLTYMIREGQLKTDKVGVITKVATSLVITVLVGLLLLNIPLIPIFA